MGEVVDFPKPKAPIALFLVEGLSEQALRIINTSYKLGCDSDEIREAFEELLLFVNEHLED